MKKWLSYRERALVGRDLAPDEARGASVSNQSCGSVSIAGNRSESARTLA
jgi:hypothetical protein